MKSKANKKKAPMPVGSGALLGGVICKILDEQWYSAKRDKIQPTEKISEMPFDSLDRVEILMALEEELCCSIEDDAVEWAGWESLTIGEYAENLAAKLWEKGINISKQLRRAA